MPRTEVTPSGLHVVTNRFAVIRERLNLPDTVVDIYDTGMRDGLQGDAAMSPEARVDAVNMIFETLPVRGKLGGIELGWPGANAGTNKFVELSRNQPYWAHGHVFGMTRHAFTDVEKDKFVGALVSSESPGITFVGKSSLQHIERNVLGEETTPAENIKMIRDSVEYAKAQKHVERVYYDAEHFFDGYNYDPEYAMETLYAAAEGGADCVVLCDTNGYAIFPEVGLITGDVINDELLHEKYRKAHNIANKDVKMPVGIHTHGDIKMAEANALAAVMAGAVHVQGVVNGTGERVGNMDEIPILVVLDKLGMIDMDPEKMRQLKGLSDRMYDLAELERNPNQAVTGRNAFRTAAGMHGDSTLKWRGSYAGIDPSEVGNDFVFGVDENSGKSLVAAKMDEFGIDAGDEKDSAAVAISRKVKENEALGYRYAKSEASLYLLMRRHFKEAYDEEVPFKLDFERSTDGTEPKVTVTTNGHHELLAGEASHIQPAQSMAVNADTLYMSSVLGSLKDAVKGRYPQVEDVMIVTDSKKIVNGTPRVVLTATDGTHRWIVESVAGDLNTAIWTAAADALEYHVWQTKDTPNPKAA